MPHAARMFRAIGMPPNCGRQPGWRRWPDAAARYHLPGTEVVTSRAAAVGLVSLLAAAAFVGLPAAMEERFLYFPSRTYDALPGDEGLRATDIAPVTGDGVSLAGWWIHGAGEIPLLYFHGNAGNVSHRLERSRLLVEHLGIDVVLVDYRGYGRSGGRPSEAGLYADGEAVLAAAAARGFPSERMVLFGESLGAAVAVELALRHRFRAVVLETPFLSVPAMAKAHYPYVPRFLLRTRFDNESKIGRISAPKLIIAAERDEIVPRGHAERLYELARPPRELFVIRGARHNDTYRVGGTEYLAVWRRFLEETRPP